MLNIIKYGVMIGCLVSTSLYAQYTPTNNFEIEGLATENATIETADKHHPFLGLFGAGFTELTADEKSTAFENYYNFCKVSGDGLEESGLGDFDNTSTDPINGNPKHNFKLILTKLNAIENFNAGEVTVSENNWSLENVEVLFDSWLDGLGCTKYFSYNLSFFDQTSSFNIEEYTGDVINNSYQKVTDDDGSVHYLNCYDSETERNRDIRLYLSETNTTKILDAIDSTSDINGFIVFTRMFMAMVTAESNHFSKQEFGFNSGNSGNPANPSFNYSYFNIQGLTFTEDYNGADTDVEALLATDLAKENGLGYYCSKINALHVDLNQTNASSMETCIKNHVEAVVRKTGSEEGICKNNLCKEQTLNLTGNDNDESAVEVTGGLSNGFYTFPNFGYCSNDIDFDGFITTGNEYNWGEFTAANMVPYANAPDVCPDDKDITNTLPTWFQINNPEETRQSCTQPSGFVATRDEAQPNFDFEATSTSNAVVISRLSKNDTFINKLRVASENSAIVIQALDANDGIDLVHSNTKGIQTSKVGETIISYCFTLKREAGTTDYFIKIPATGTAKGVIESYQLVDADDKSYTPLSLNSDNEVQEGETVIRTSMDSCEFN